MPRVMDDRWRRRIPLKGRSQTTLSSRGLRTGDPCRCRSASSLSRLSAHCGKVTTSGTKHTHTKTHTCTYINPKKKHTHTYTHIYTTHAHEYTHAHKYIFTPHTYTYTHATWGRRNEHIRSVVSPHQSPLELPGLVCWVPLAPQRPDRCALPARTFQHQ